MGMQVYSVYVLMFIPQGCVREGKKFVVYHKSHVRFSALFLVKVKFTLVPLAGNVENTHVVLIRMVIVATLSLTYKICKSLQ